MALESIKDFVGRARSSPESESASECFVCVVDVHVACFDSVAPLLSNLQSQSWSVA